MVELQKVRTFWEQNPVGAQSTKALQGSYDYFRKLDNLREASNCEPYAFSDKIHEYTHSQGKRVLDVGCGHGYVLSHYALNGADVHGIDLTERAVELSRKRFVMMGLSGQFRQSGGETIPYPDAHFDVVCSMGVLHHIPDPRPMLLEIHRVLRPGGRLILMFYNKNSFRNHVTFRFRQWFGLSIYRGKSLEAIRNMNDGPECPLAMVYTPAEVRLLLEGLFTDLSWSLNKLSYEELFLFSKLGGLISRLFPNPSESFFAKRWGWNLYIKARKL